MTAPAGGDGQPGAAEEPASPENGRAATERRARPGLLVGAWLSTIVGGGLIAAGLLGAHGTTTFVLAIGGLVLLGLGLIAGAGSQALGRRARGVAGYAGPSPLLVFAAVIPVTFLLQIVVSAPLQGLGLDLTSPLALLVGLLVSAFVYVALIRLLVVGTGALHWTDMGIRAPRIERLTEFAVGALMGFPIIVLTGILAALLSSFLAIPTSPLPPSGGLTGAVLNLVSAAIVAPVAEETFFRGFATTAWLRSIGPTGAIVRGAVFFSAVHLVDVGATSLDVGIQQAVFAFVVRLPVALALGWIFVRSRSLYASIGLHSAFNGLPVLVQLFIGA